MPTALISGVTGQDGAYLSELLLEKGYDVVGIIRRSSSIEVVGGRLKWLGIFDRVRLLEGDLTDLSSLIRIVQEVRPAEVYNLAAQSFVATSWQQPILTGNITGLGAVNMLEAIRLACPDARFYQASSSEMFGGRGVEQDEDTPFQPRSPYAIAKLYAHWMTINYRESYDMHASAGILFNHESPLRGMEFVTRRVTDAVARIKLGISSELELGNLESRRDWGHARDYVRAMWEMVQADKPDDFVVATGRSVSIRDMVKIAFDIVGLDWKNFVHVRQHLMRPAEVDTLLGNASKIKLSLGWGPTISLEAMLSEMVNADLVRNKAQM
jgi:GDPmannose 4,6-dehydratase